MPFERPDWKPQPERTQPWRQWYPQVDKHKTVATDDELEAKPWLKARDSAIPHDVAFIQNNDFYKWMSAESTKNLYLCNQGR